MANVVLFLNSFFSYLLLFAFVVALVVIACVIGAKWRKSSDAKKAASGQPSMPDMVDIKE
ncbi:MAG TPA: hypothetical protein DCZ40_14590 [Lachnospiraceae bacterium]|nr:hypothetical protein [Lachnospiraceae bacterium]